jgi:signal transduction histidine kinase/CheY-like chemotaxis protein/HPt (histidine-containing phosphotransfer) domain-containing protein
MSHPIIKPYIEKVKAFLHFLSGQMLIVFFAFAIMAFASYFFLGTVERKHLLRDIDGVMTNAQIHIRSELMEPETALGVISETIRNMVLSGYESSKVHDYIVYINGFMQSEDDDRMVGVIGCYGIFDAYDRLFLAGNKTYVLPEDYDLESRLWYMTAIDADGEVGVTQPYTDAYSNEIIITFARRLFDDEGTPLGIVCLDMTLDRIRGYVVNTRVTDDGYGILGDANLLVLAHPHPSYLGRSLRLMNDGEAIADILLQGGEISERKATDFTGNKSVLFVRQLENGWVLAIIAYAREYYKSVTYIGLILCLLGLVMAIMLNIILWRITKAKEKSDLENRQKSNFLATVSHEIRTPLNAILGIAEIEMQNQALPKSTTEAVGKIYNSGYILLGIINDILDLSKIEAGKLELVLVRYDVASLIHDTVQLNMMRIGSKMIKFDLQVDPVTPAELYGDELRIKQILNNLLTNAFKYTEQGAVVLSVTAKYEDRVRDPHVQLTFRVTDTGQGMSPAQVRKLFDEYSRFNLEANRLTEGTGLGMSITRSLVQMMNGNISVESELGRGSTFTVHLPQKSVGASSLGAQMVENLRRFRIDGTTQMKAQPIVRDPMPYGSVLVVDDVETNLYVAKGLLSPYGLTIDTAISGYEAIDKIASGNVYDIIFMDHMMPEMDGIEATKIIHELGYTKPVVALTANAVAGMAEIFLSNGFDDFISKPIDIRQLNACLNKLIRDKQTPEMIESARNDSLKKLATSMPSSSLTPELTAAFVTDAGKAATILEGLQDKLESLNDDEIKTYIINVHAMKSALANIGEIELSGTARMLETAGKEQNIVLLSTGTPTFINDLRALIKKITPTEESKEIIDEDKAHLRERLFVFREACAAYDKKAAKEILVELKKGNWSHQTKETLNILVEHLLHSDFEEAAGIAKDLASLE